MQRKNYYPFIVLIYSLLTHTIALLQFITKFSTLGIPEHWYGDGIIALCMSFICSFILFLLWENIPAKWVLLGIRFFLLWIIGYPLGQNIGVELTLLTALVFETGYYTTQFAGILFSLLIITATVVSQRPADVWDYRVLRTSFDNLLFLGTYPLIILVFSLFLKHHRRLSENRKKLIEQLNSASTKLVDTNLQLQEYIVLNQENTIRLERKRISREIHDIIGHTLMSIILMMKAALNIREKDRKQLYKFLEHTKEQAERGLMETRKAMALLRSSPVQRVTLVDSIHRLVKAFQGTHVSLTVEFGNIPWNFDSTIDSVLLRIVQEGITNAIRHGNAGRIDIYFWYNGKEIILTINNDGQKNSEPGEGIGLSGMKERVKELSGELDARETIEGFQLRALIPWIGSDGANEEDKIAHSG